MSPRTTRRPLIAATAAAAAVGLTAAPLAAHAIGGIVDRLSGADRYETAVDVAQLGFPQGGAPAVVLAQGNEYADALAGGPLAADRNAPLLLTHQDRLTAATAAELERVLAEDGTVYLLGGPNAVDEAVETAVEDLGFDVQRIGGANRYETALAVAEELGADGPIFLSTGTDFPDALAAGAAAASNGGQVLLTSGSTMPSAVRAEVATHDGAVYAIGGPAGDAAAQIEGLSVTLVKGENRYDTAVEVAERFFDDHDGFVLASGEKFPDALAGGASSGRNDDPVLLTQQDNLPDVTAAYLAEAAQVPYLLGFVTGGESAVSQAVVEAADEAMQPVEDEEPAPEAP